MFRPRPHQSHVCRPAPRRRLCRRCVRPTTRMLGGARRSRPPNFFALAWRKANKLIRQIQRLRKRNPDLFDYAAIARQEAWKAEVRCALDRIYGAPPLKTEPPEK